MPCQELGSCLTQNQNPQGDGLATSRPSGDGFCRSFDFSQGGGGGNNIVTFTSDNIVTFGGDEIVTF